jgi:arylformamidase
MKIHDISLLLSPQLPTWPGDPPMILERFSKIEEGAFANISRLVMGVHTGTHIDAPYHFFAEGGKVESVPLDLLIGPAVVLQLPDDVKNITAEVLKKAVIPAGCRRLLLKTANSQIWARGETDFQRDFVALNKDGADALIERGVQLIGIDYLSIASFDQPGPTHIAFLGAGVIVIEGVDLSRVEAGEYMLVCLPLKLVGAEGAPARVVLLED